MNGRQDHIGVLRYGPNETDSSVVLPGSGSFRDHYASVHVNANKFFQTADRQFVQLSLGVNADLDVGSARSYTGDPFVLADQELPPSFIGQAHVKVGYGFRTRGRSLIIPTLETPVVSVVPGDKGFGQLQWFNSRYRPLILSIRFLFLRYPKGFACPPAIKPNALEGKKKVYKPDSYHRLGGFCTLHHLRSPSSLDRRQSQRFSVSLWPSAMLRIVSPFAVGA